MPGLQFPIIDFVREVQILHRIAADFLDDKYIWSLFEFEDSIKGLSKAAKESKLRLELDPLHTIPTKIKGQEIYAVFTGVWDVSPTDKPQRKKSSRKIRFCGIASTKVELYEVGDSAAPISMLRFELGTHNSPGCYFHTQILGESADPPFPNSLSIPRLPTLFVTPMAAIEYVIGELFQEKWKNATKGSTADAHKWRKLQLDRLKLLFDWYQDSMTELDTSPWMSIKSAKPKDDMFLSRATPSTFDNPHETGTTNPYLH